MSKVNKLTDSSGQHLRGKHHCAYCGQVIASLVPINEGRAAVIQHALNCPQHPCHLEIKSLQIERDEARRERDAAVEDLHTFRTYYELWPDHCDIVKKLRAAIARKDEALKLITEVELRNTFTCSSGEFDPHCSVCIAKRALESKL